MNTLKNLVKNLDNLSMFNTLTRKQELHDKIEMIKTDNDFEKKLELKNKLLSFADSVANDSFIDCDSMNDNCVKCDQLNDCLNAM